MAVANAEVVMGARLHGRGVSAAIAHARQQRLAEAHGAAWWTVFEHAETYDSSPFAADPVEHFVIGHRQPYPVKIYNFACRSANSSCEIEPARCA